jgi:hypothetical protein
VRFGEAVAAEALDLLEDAFGELRCIAALDHARDQSLVVRAHAAVALPGRHRAA